MSRSRQPKPRAKPPAAGEGGVAPGGAAPHAPPIGLVVAGVAKRIGRAFDDALAQAGGARPVWLILLSLKAQRPETQRELAAAVGIEGATLTHHLDGMERAGLVSRERVPENRRVQRVELTPAGERMFLRLRDAAMAHDARLREGLDAADLERLRELLARMEENVARP
jgi:MarR family transcriptional regulator, transcriptional regulator for hemolysin